MKELKDTLKAELLREKMKYLRYGTIGTEVPRKIVQRFTSHVGGRIERALKIYLGSSSSGKVSRVLQGRVLLFGGPGYRYLRVGSENINCHELEKIIKIEALDNDGEWVPLWVCTRLRNREAAL